MPQAVRSNTTPALPVDLPRAARRKVERAIETHLAAAEAHSKARDALVAFLDKLDGDADLEPSLGNNPYGSPLAALDAEGDEHDGREPDEDLEPSLGAPEWVGYIPSDGPGGPRFSQARWASGNTADLEEQCEDEGAQVD